MKSWTGTVRLAGGRTEGDEVTARIVVISDGDLVVDISRGNDVLGVRRWEAASAHELDPVSLYKALAERS